MASISRSREPQIIIEILDSDDEKDHDSSATDNSDVEFVAPRAPAQRASISKSSRAVPTLPLNTNSKGKGKQRETETDLDSAWQHFYGDLKPTTSAKDASLEPRVGSSRIRHLEVAKPNTEVLEEQEENKVSEADADPDAVFARKLQRDFDNQPYIVDGVDFGAAPGPGPGPGCSSKRKRHSPSSSNSESEDDRLLSPVEDDAAYAARLAREFEEAENKRKELEESDALYAKTVYAADELAEKVRRKKLDKTGEKIQKIAYQVTMDGDGKTIEGDEDAENMNHLALVRNQFMAGGIANGLEILKVTYFVNFELNARFEAAKDALAEQGRDATERTLFHGTPQKNLQAILENGFRIGGVDGRVVNGTACGIGVYLATCPMTSVHYCAGSNAMFACRVVTGLTTTTPQQGNPGPPGSNPFDAYEVGGIIVARTAAQVLPRYLVEFKWDYGAMYGNPLAGIPLLGRLFQGPAGPAPAVGTSTRRAPRKAPKKSRKSKSNTDLADTARAAYRNGDSDPDDEPVQHRSDQPTGGYGRARANPLAGLAAGVMIDPVTMRPLDSAAAAKKRRKR